MVLLHLDEPPLVANAGVGIHGTSGPADTFLLPDLWQLHLYSYSGELTLDGIRYPIRPGYTSLVPAGQQVHFRYEGRSEHLFVHFRPAKTGAAKDIPIMQDATSCAEALHSRMRQAISAAPRHALQASAEVWAALWRIAQLSERTSSTGHTAVAEAMDFIEAHLAEPITVPQIARHAGISHNHLTRLFRAETGTTVVAHLRTRRLARADHLLRHSTLPISVVASSTGIPDLQAFNKACRLELGAAPRAIRAVARHL